jgi:hypothetical protein
LSRAASPDADCGLAHAPPCSPRAFEPPTFLDVLAARRRMAPHLIAGVGTFAASSGGDTAAR